MMSTWVDSKCEYVNVKYGILLDHNEQAQHCMHALGGMVSVDGKCVSRLVLGGPVGGAGLLLPTRGAQLHAAAARPAAATKGSGVPAAGALPPPPTSGSRFTVFGKNLTNVAPGSEQQVRVRMARPSA